MIVESIELKDFALFKEFYADTNFSVIGVMGTNGMGKTSLLKALRFGFTGVAASERNEEPLESFIRDYEQAGGAKKATVDIRFRKSGVQGRIIRHIGAGNKRELHWDGKVLQSAAKVDETMDDIFGADKVSRANAIFIPQGKLHNLLSGKQSERELLYMQMFLVANLEKISEIATRHAKFVKSSIRNFSEVENHLQASLDETNQALWTALDRHNHTIDYRPARAYWQQLHSAESTIKQHDSALVQLRTELQELQVVADQALALLPENAHSQYEKMQREQAQLQNTLENYETCTQELTSFHASTHSLAALKREMEVTEHTLENSPSEESVNQALKNLNEQLVRAVLRDKLNADLVASASQVAQKSLACTEFLRTRPASDLNTLRDRYDQANAAFLDLKYKKEALDLVADAGRGTPACCPVCESGQLDPAHLAQRLAVINTQFETARKVYEDARQAKQAAETVQAEFKAQQAVLMREYAEELAKSSELKTQLSALPADPELTEIRKQHTLQTLIQKTREQLLKTRTANQNRINGLSLFVASFSEVRIKHLEKVKNSYGDTEKIKAELEKLAEAIPDIKNRIETYERARQAVANRRTDFEKQEKKLRKAQEEYTALYEQRPPALQNSETQSPDWLDARIEEYMEQAASIKLLNEQLEKLQNEQKRIASEIEKDEPKRRLVGELDQLSSAFSRTGIPMAYMRDKFEHMLPFVQHNLEGLTDKFTVRADPTNPVTYQFNRVDGASSGWFHQNKLSGGQRVDLALANLLAVQQLILPEVAFLNLDEPSFHLDSESRERLRDMLISLRQKLRNSESQIWVSDHHEELIPAFEKMIQL